MEDHDVGRQVGDDVAGKRVDGFLESLRAGGQLGLIHRGHRDPRGLFKHRRRILCVGHGVYEENDQGRGNPRVRTFHPVRESHKNRETA